MRHSWAQCWSEIAGLGGLGALGLALLSAGGCGQADAPALTVSSSGGSTATGGSQTEMGGSGDAGGVSTSGGTTVARGGTAPGRGGSQAGGSPNSLGGKASGGITQATGGKASGGTNGSGGSNRAGGTTGTGGSTVTGGLPRLHVEGNAIKDPSGKTIVLRGVSLIDVGTLYYNASQNASGITGRIDKIIAAGLLPHVIRLPVYPRTCFNTGGSPMGSAVPFPVGTAASGNRVNLTADEYLSKVLKPAVDYATQKKYYVIIDYHQIDDTDGQSATDATTFWQFMAAKFASYANVLYEPYNEPIDSTTAWTTFKPRVQAWIDTIRGAAPENLIIVPSMSWDQKPGDASSSPPTGANLVYTAHVYPGNWTTAFKQQVATAVAKVPVFFTEWGYVLNGSDTNLGTSDTTWGTSFQTLVDGNGASWTAWVTDNSWTPNMFSSSALTTLTDFGTVAKNWLAAKQASDWVE